MDRGRDYTPPDARDPVARLLLPDRQQSRESAIHRGGGSGGPDPQADSRTVDRERAYDLRGSEIQTLAEIGAFRTLTVEDLTRYRYAGDHGQAQREVRNLTRQGLVLVRTTHPSRAVYVALTREGHRLLKRHRPEGTNPGQVFYSRFVKPREVRHDAALYQLYQEVSERITRAGGQVRRVVLDFELKKSINAKLAKLGSLPEADQPAAKQRIAEEYGLVVVNGKIPLPDLRIEYETADRDQTKVDLELATSDYHRDSLAAKVQAGFAVYALREDAMPLRRAIGDPQLMKDILSL